MAVDANLKALTDILLGAAYADGTGDGEELLAVRELLKEIHGGPLPDELEKHISTFSPKGFDVAKAAAAFKGGAKITPRRALELCAQIRDVDEEIDLAEDEYIKTLGKALGLAAKDFADLTLDVDVEEVKAAYKPPPAPPKK